MTPAWIEPATFRFVAQHLNHCATAVPYPTMEPTKYRGYNHQIDGKNSVSYRILIQLFLWLLNSNFIFQANLNFLFLGGVNVNIHASQVSCVHLV